MKRQFSQKKYVDVIFPPLWKYWENAADDSPDVFPIFNCFLHISKAMGRDFAQFVPVVFARYEP